MSENYSNVGQQISIAIIGTAFVVLKLCHVIDWSWWWVTAPFWAPAGLMIAVLTVIALAAVIKKVMKR